jgi:hypothetical protein
MAEKEPTINLLPQKSESLLNQFLDWSLAIGRLLVILTEIVALGTFLYRFSLDAQLVNYHDKIKSESFILDNFSNAEATFRDIQTRLATVKQYEPLDDTTANIFTGITKLGQGKITFADLTVSTQDAKIEVEAQTGDAISQFITALKTDPSITEISVDKVVNDTSSAQIIVYITATLKPAAFLQTSSQTTNAAGNTVLNEE